MGLPNENRLQRSGRREFLTAVGATGTFALAGCTAGQDESTEEPAGDTTPTATVTGTSDAGAILGIPMPLSGKYGPNGQHATRWVRRIVENIINENPPLDTPVEHFTQDTQSKPDAAITAVRSLMAEGAETMVGGSSEVLIALQDILRENKVTFFTGGSGTTRLNDRPGDWIFRAWPRDDLIAIAWAVWLYNQGYETASMIYQNDPGGKAYQSTFESTFPEVGGEVLETVPVRKRRSSYRQQIQSAFDPDPDVVILSTGAPTGNTILEQWFEMDIGGQWMVVENLQTPDTIQKTGPEVLAGAFTMAASTQGPAYQVFEDHYYQYFDNLFPIHDSTYDATLVQMLAVEHAGEYSGEAISNHVREVSNPPGKPVYSWEIAMDLLKKGQEIDYQGAATNCNFDEHGDIATDFAVLQFNQEASSWQNHDTIGAGAIAEYTG